MYVDHIDVIKAFINSHHGWAVADQFVDSWEDNDFTSQNPNALELIEESLTALLEAGIFVPMVEEEIEAYLDQLRDWTEAPDEEEDDNQ